MQDLGVVTTFTGGLAAALLLGFVAHRLTLSPIVGYLVAGVAVGPFTPGFVAHQAVAEQFAEIGVILLLFGIGLRFQLRELAVVWRIALPGALIQSTVSTATLALLVRAVLGWEWSSGIILGMAISVASTVVMAMVLAERHDLHAPIGHIAIGWTVVEDLLTVAALLLLPMVVGADRGGQPPAGAIGLAAVRVAALAAVVVVLGRWVIPWMLERIAGTRSRELFTLAVLVLAIGIAVGSAEVFGVSMALGAFLAGLAVGRSEFAARAAGDAVPMRDAFAVLFFVSVGMLFDPRSLAHAPLLTGIVLLVVVIGKPLVTLLTVRAFGRPQSTALPVGAALAQVGEFSFILSAVARDLGLVSADGWNAVVAASIVSIALNPTLYRWARQVSSTAGTRAPSASPGGLAVDPNRCILVGYGPVGQIVHRLLADRGATVTIVDLNLATVRRLRTDGHAALYGDVLRPATLDEAGIASAGYLVLSADVEDAAEVIRQARLLNPSVRILARCSHLRDAVGLRRAGANVVASGEAEVGVALAEAVAADSPTDERAAAEHREAVRRHLYASAGNTPDNEARRI